MKLLVVDDDVKIAAALQRGLEAEGYTVELAHDGDRGWQMASEGRYDLIVLDIMMPGRNGYVLCRDLRAAGISTPVLMLTAKDGDLDEAEGLDLGADDYLTKPFSFAVLSARLRALLRRRNVAASPGPQQTGDLLIDTAARVVTLSDRAVELTRREFDVLEFLCRRPGHVVTKDDVLRGVWEFDYDGDPNIVEVYVGRLRRKLESASTTIVTVRGVGYRVDVDGTAAP